MALSEHERQILEQMEAEFRTSDPDFADSLRGRTRTKPIPRVSPRIWAAMVCLLLLGLVLLVVGVSLPHRVAGVIVAIVGFGLMVAGLSAPFSRLARSRRTSKPGQRTSGGFMDRQRDQWDRRHQR